MGTGELDMITQFLARIEQRMDEKFEKINDVINELKAKLESSNTSCISNQRDCRQQLDTIFIKKDNLPGEVEKIFKQIQDERLDNISKFRKLTSDIYSIIKVIAVLGIAFYTLPGVKNVLELLKG